MSSRIVFVNPKDLKICPTTLVQEEGGGGNNLRGGQHSLCPPPPIIHPHFPFGKNHKCTKLKGKMIINETLIWFEGTGKTIPFNSTLEFSIWSDFKMRNVIIWHWLYKNLVGTWRQYDAMCLLDIWHPLPPPPPPPPPPNILNLPTPM